MFIGIKTKNTDRYFKIITNRIMQLNAILGLYLTLRVIYGAPDNAGTEFIIGFMGNFPIKQSFDNQLFITTLSNDIVHVNITAPRENVLILNEETTVVAGEVKKIIIDKGFAHDGTELQSKGILVSASHEVVVYGINREKYSLDGFLALPTDVLDNEYIAVCYSPSARATEVLVVGVEDGSSVSILLPGNTGVEVTFQQKIYRQNEWINITMNRLDSFQISSMGDLTNTKVLSNKPVAAFSGNKKTGIIRKTEDHLVEQLFPVSTWGKSFATVPIPDVSTGDVFRFITSEPNTRIRYVTSINGTTNTTTFVVPSANSYVEELFGSNWYVFIESDKPILLAQFVKSQINDSEPSDPSMILIPSIQQYAADYTFTTPQFTRDPGSSYFNYIMFIVKRSAQGGLLLNNKPLPKGTVYHDMPNTSPELVGGYIPLPEGTYTFRHTSPIEVFGAVLFGRQILETYGFPAGLRLSPINKPCLPTPVVRGDGFDNDCDGRIDEELCYPFSTDNDLDGKTNEDCAAINHVDEQLITEGTLPENPEQMNILFPKWFHSLEIMILSLISVIFVGLSLCVCIRCCTFCKRSDDDDEEDESKRKYRRSRGRRKSHLTPIPKGWRIK